jgi:NAD(P)-dependent dehydrogenase (short-subunit alcohol dehydrogenase family)
MDSASQMPAADHCVLAHRLFASFHDPVFRLAEADGPPGNASQRRVCETHIVLVTAPGCTPSAGPGLDAARRAVDAHLLLPLQVARNAASKVRPAGTLLFMGGTGARRTAPGLTFIGALTAAMPAMTKNLALELAPIRVNLIAAGFVDTPLSAALLADQLDVRREQLRATLPIRRVVGPDDIATLAIHLMTNTALTGATFDIDGGQQLLSG